MKAHLLLLADDAALVQRVQALFGEAVQLSVLPAQPLASMLRRAADVGEVDALLVELNGQDIEERATLLHMLGERFAPLPVCALAAQPDSILADAARRARAKELFVLGRDDARLYDRLGAARRGAAASASTRRENVQLGQVFAVLSGHPYDGIAFLGTHLAIALRETQPLPEVLLLDLATPQGAGAIFLNLSAPHSALDLLWQQPSEEAAAEVGTVHAASGLRVSCLPETLQRRPDFDADNFERWLQVLRERFQYVVITLDGHLPLAVLSHVLALAERSVLLSDQSILKTRQSRHLLDALRAVETPLQRAGLVVDNYRHRLGLEPKNIAELFRLPLLGVLNSERYNRVVAMNTGEPLFSLFPDDPYCAGVRELAARLLGVSLPPEAPKALKRPRSVFGRLF